MTGKPLSPRDYLWVVLALCWLLPAGPAQASDDGPIRVAVLQIPPYAVHDEDGNLRGVFIEFFREVARRGQIDMNIRALPAARLGQYIQDGRTDCTVYIRTPVTEKLAAPLIYLGLNFRSAVIARKSANLRRYDDLKHLVLGVSRGTYFGNKIDTDPELNRMTTNDYLHAAKLMKRGRVDAVLGIEWSVLYDIKEAGIPAAEIGPPLVLNENQLWAFCSRKARASAAQVTRLKTVIGALVEAGYLKTLLDSYIR